MILQTRDVKNAAAALVVHDLRGSPAPAVEVGDVHVGEIESVVGPAQPQYGAAVGQCDVVVVLTDHGIAEKQMPVSGAEIAPDLGGGVGALSDPDDLATLDQASEALVVVAELDGIAA